MIVVTPLLIPLVVTGAAVAFWMLAPVMILAALGMILARKPVHSALCLAAVMISLAVQYAALDAPFLFVVQIIVYTGAILMLLVSGFERRASRSVKSARATCPAPVGASVS